jgi:hypothetical protein
MAHVTATAALTEDMEDDETKVFTNLADPTFTPGSSQFPNELIVSQLPNGVIQFLTQETLSYGLFAGAGIITTRKVRSMHPGSLLENSVRGTLRCRRPNIVDGDNIGKKMIIGMGCGPYEILEDTVSGNIIRVPAAFIGFDFENGTFIQLVRIDDTPLVYADGVNLWDDPQQCEDDGLYDYQCSGSVGNFDDTVPFTMEFILTHSKWEEIISVRNATKINGTFAFATEEQKTVDFDTEEVSLMAVLKTAEYPYNRMGLEIISIALN